MIHIVFLSGGKDSSALAVELKERHPGTDFLYVCTPTGNELPEMVAHWARLGEILGSPIVPVAHPDGLAGLIEKKQAIPNHFKRWCTDYLKRRMAAAFLAELGPCTVYVGLRADEAGRPGIDYPDLPHVTVRFPFKEWGWTLRDVRSCLDRHGIEIPVRTDCAVCFWQRIGEWYRLWRDHPDYYAQGVQWEEMTGHTFRHPSRDTWPAALKDLAAEFAGGRIPRSEWKTAANSGQCRVCSL